MQKDYGLSVIRFLAMGCVIFCHCLEQSNHRVTGNYLAVGVQLFLLLSGYLYSHREFGDSKSRINFVIRNFYKILLDYYVYLILFVIPIYFWLDRQQITSSSIYRLATCSGNFGGIHHLWYIPYCLFCYLITPWLYDIKCAFFEENKGYVGGILKIGALGLGTHIIMVAYGSYFLPDKIICYILGYFLPYILKNKKGISVVFGVNAIFMVFSNTIRYYYKYVWDVSYFSKSSIRRLDLLYDYACISLGLFIFLTVFFLTRKMRGGGYLQKILDVSDKLSYDIYLTHMIYVKGILSIIGKTGSYFCDILIILAVCILSGCCLHILCHVCIPKVCRALRFGRYYGVK